MTDKRLIVLVDDEAALVWSLAGRLAKVRPDVRFETAQDGSSALALLRREPIALLITDVRMPGMSGVELVLAARELYPELPVVMMSAFKSPEVRRAFSGPFTGFLEKPFEFDRLLELIERGLEPPSLGFSGAISVQTLPDIVQLYALSSATGALTVTHKTDVGEIWFDRGAIRHAVTANAVGDDAVYETMMWLGGEFSMRAGARTNENSVTSNWQELLMESCRRLDELKRAFDPPSKTGWTQAPPALEDDFELDFPDFIPRPASVVDLEVQTAEPNEVLEVSMNVKEALAKLNQMDGFIGAALVDSESGMLLGQEGGGALNLEIAAAGNTEVVRAKRKTMSNLALKDAVEDILITLGKQYHMIRPLRSRPGIFFYVALDRQRSNLAMARIALADVEKELQV